MWVDGEWIRVGRAAALINEIVGQCLMTPEMAAGLCRDGDLISMVRPDRQLPSGSETWAKTSSVEAYAWRIVHQNDKRDLRWCVQERARIVEGLTIGGVYFLASGPYVKIGFARDIHGRIEDLRVGIPFQLECIGIVRCAPEDLRAREREHHARFAAHRVRGEWFWHKDDLATYIATLEQLP